MSKPQEPHRPFFPFGNPFRMIPSKGSNLSPTLLALVNTFEVTLSARLKKLETVGDILSLTWMQYAMESLCETHTDIKNLIEELELPVSDWDEKWIDVYLDISIKLLDISNAFSSELSRMNQGHLLIQCALHNLESNSQQQHVHACSFLNNWRQQRRSKNPRLEKCCSFLDGLMETLNLPKVKYSAKGKVLMRALYGVKVQTLFICSAFVVLFSGSSKKLFELDIPNTYQWAEDFNHLRGTVNGMIRRNQQSSQNNSLMKELLDIDTAVEKLCPLMLDGSMSRKEYPLQISVRQLKTDAEKFSSGLNLLMKEVDRFFHVVLTGRDALLSHLRAMCTATDSAERKTLGQLVL